MSELVLAVPSKGRLEEMSRAVFAEAGMAITRPGGARSYAGAVEGVSDVTVRFLPAGEIARELVRGTVDLGITGVDLIHETAENGMERVVLACDLGFGQADVVVAIPDAWIDVTHMRDLSDVASDFRARHGRWLRVATKYINLTRHYFAEHGIAEYRIVESVGATEAAPASGAADLIVDITSTGSTLKANGLRILADGTILKSAAHLITANGDNWTAGQRMVVSQLLTAMGVTSAED